VRKELKIVSISLMILVMTACSATRKRSAERVTVITDAMAYRSLIEQVRSNNIAEDGFYVRKGKIDIEGTAIDGSYGFNARYNTKGDLNASVKGPLGIELLRLLSVNGQVYLVDRIGKTVYRGSTSAILTKYGLPDNVIAVIFGDLISTGNETYSISGRERIMIRGDMNNMERQTDICIKDEKICEEIYKDRISGNEVLLRYDNFRNTEGKKYASLIYMEEKKKKLQIRIKIDDLICGYEEEINLALPSYRVRNL
jgi:hypothetical protein